MPALTGHDKPWPFFHFWRHHFWPKLASSMLNFCGRRRSCQWCPDQSDRPNGAWDMHKNAQKVERTTQTKICCHYTWLLHGENCPSWWRFLRSFLTASKPSRRSITAAKNKRKGEKGRAKKKIPKLEKPKDIGRFLVQKLKNFISAHACPSQNVTERVAGGKKAKRAGCKCIFDQIKGNLTEIQPKNYQNVQETSFLQKAPGRDPVEAPLSTHHANKPSVYDPVDKMTSDSRQIERGHKLSTFPTEGCG